MLALMTVGPGQLVGRQQSDVLWLVADASGASRPHRQVGARIPITEHQGLRVDTVQPAESLKHDDGQQHYMGLGIDVDGEGRAHLQCPRHGSHATQGWAGGSLK
jgi:hypothetical protein